MDVDDFITVHLEPNTPCCIVCVCVCVRLPLSSLSQCGFLVWCMLPMENNGSVVIYHRLIKPFVKKHETAIDSAFKTTQQLAGEVASKGIYHCTLFSTTDLCQYTSGAWIFQNLLFFGFPRLIGIWQLP